MIDVVFEGSLRIVRVVGRVEWMVRRGHPGKIQLVKKESGLGWRCNCGRGGALTNIKSIARMLIGWRSVVIGGFITSSRDDSILKE
jgi:hypothetical protein